MKKPIKFLGIAGMAFALLFGAAGCGSSEADKPVENPPVDQPSGGDDGDTTAVIKSLTANEETVKISVGEKKSLTAYYTLVGYKSLSAAQKKCIYEVSDSTIASIKNTSITALKTGEVTVTIKSKIDTTKSCSFKLVIKDVFFDRTISKFSPECDFEHELLADGGYIQSSQTIQGDYYIKGVCSTKILISADITIIKVSDTEKFPKCGIIFSTGDQTTQMTDNKLTFFINAEIGDQGISHWRNFGVCEVQNGGNWAWNDGVTNANARSKTNLYSNPDDVTYGTKFNITVARDGFDFHFWVNGVYAASFTTLEDLFGNNDGTKFVPANSYVGFFQFFSDVKYENYSVVTDEAKVAEKINSVTEKTYITDWDQD